MLFKIYLQSLHLQKMEFFPVSEVKNPTSDVAKTGNGERETGVVS